MTAKPTQQKQIKVDYLARVEGEGALDVVVENNRISHLELRIFEPPRFFEAFLRGRSFEETPDIVARICGICPVAYQMSAVHALEKALAVSVTPAIRRLRRLFYCGEWIESHALHIYLLHAPDFLNHESAISMAADPELRPLVEKGLRIKKIGNDLVSLIGGREIHPISACVGGFYKAPDPSELRKLKEELEWGLSAAIDTVAWTANLTFPEFTPDYEFIALSHPDEYPMNEGRVISSKGLDIPMAAFEDHFEEEHLAHSNAFHTRRKDGGSYMVGPLARLNLNLARLSANAEKAMRKAGVKFPSNNPYLSIVARSIELVFAFEESLRLLQTYEQPLPSRVRPTPQAGEGRHLTEAPRGLLYHHYRLDNQGLISDARIIAPTTQNLKRIEEDLRLLVPQVIDLPVDDATWRCEQLIRNYDPCISCATHFLNLSIRRDA